MSLLIVLYFPQSIELKSFIGFIPNANSILSLSSGLLYLKKEKWFFRRHKMIHFPYFKVG
jgi:hypothetical protein